MCVFGRTCGAELVECKEAIIAIELRKEAAKMGGEDGSDFAEMRLEP